MKIIYKYFLSVMTVFVITLGFGCKKSFLEVTPKGRLVASTVSDYSQLITSLAGVNFTGPSTAQIPLGDEIGVVEPYFGAASLKVQRLFRWEPTIYQPNEDAGEFATTMTNIYLFNKVINEVPNATSGTEQEKLAIAGEARALRAYAYFTMINYFGKPYNTATSSSDLGFPIITDADVAQTQFTRATVSEVYSFIVNDLLTAIQSLPPRVTHRSKMSKAAAEGILGKVYVFMGRYSDALAMFNASLADIIGSAVPINLYDYNATLATGGAFTPISLTNGPAYPVIPNNQESIYGKQLTTGEPDGTSIFGNTLVLTPQTLSLFTASDRRLAFTLPSVNGGAAYPVVNGYQLRRRAGKTNIPYGPTLPDIYLLRAECKARLNDLPGAVADVQLLRNNRIADANERLVPSGLSTQALPLLRYILDERIREFAFEGYRWYDMRRLSVDPLFSNASYTHTVYTMSGTVANTFTLRPERFVLKFPTKVLAQNPTMPDND